MRSFTITGSAEVIYQVKVIANTEEEAMEIAHELEKDLDDWKEVGFEHWEIIRIEEDNNG